MLVVGQRRLDDLIVELVGNRRHHHLARRQLGQHFAEEIGIGIIRVAAPKGMA